MSGCYCMSLFAGCCGFAVKPKMGAILCKVWLISHVSKSWRVRWRSWLEFPVMCKKLWLVTHPPALIFEMEMLTSRITLSNQASCSDSHHFLLTAMNSILWITYSDCDTGSGKKCFCGVFKTYFLLMMSLPFLFLGGNKSIRWLM